MAMTATLLNGCTNNRYPFDPFGGEVLAGEIAALISLQRKKP